jgi:hypothetical protein
VDSGEHVGRIWEVQGVVASFRVCVNDRVWAVEVGKELSDSFLALLLVFSSPV